MNAITVCVDYAALLALALPYNRHHFGRWLVVSSPSDAATAAAARANGTELHVTDAFYRRGALFNKWAALEEGLDVLGREGWLCLIDADVFWPRAAPLDLELGCLYSPLRRMAPAFCEESSWGSCPVHPNVNEHAGYTQVFHAQDPALPKAPWHDLEWRHAGGADSFFQQLWPRAKKRRPPWCCLHVGESGANWAGVGKREELRSLIAQRRRNGGFSAEKLS